MSKIKLVSLFAVTALVMTMTLSVSVTSAATCVFTQNLKVGSKGDDVKCLQDYLTSTGDFTYSGGSTGYYGSITKAAVSSWQVKMGVVAVGTGYFGPLSMAKYSGSPIPPVTPPVVVTPPAQVGAPLSVMLDSSSPAASAVAKGATDVPMTYLKFTAGATDLVVSSISVKRGGISADTDISNVKLYEGAAQIGSTQALNTTNSKAAFANLNWSLPANTSKTLKVLATIATGPGVSNQVTMGIDSAADVVGATFTGLPVYGNAKTIATVAVGSLAVAIQTSPSGDVISGAVDQWIGSVKFTASTEGFNLTSVKLLDAGSSLDSDVTNFKLKLSGVQVGPTVASRTNKSVAFDLSATPLNIAVSTSKTLDVFGDIAGGVNAVRTVIISINNIVTDVTAAGTGSGGSVTATQSGTAGTMSIKQGSLSVALDATNPTAQSYVKGTTKDVLTVLKFSAGSTEGARVTQLKVTFAGTSQADTDLSNISLWDGATQVGTYVPSSSLTATFGTNTVNAFDATGLFDVPASGFKVITVTADVPTGADAAHTIKASIAAAADVKADGLSSKNDFPAASVTGTATGNAHTLIAKGTLAVTLNSATPAAMTVSKNTTAITVAKYDLTTTGEDITLSAVTLRGYVTGTTALATGDVNNVKLMDGATQLGSTVANPTTGVATFSFSLKIAKNTTKILSVVLDVPTGTTAVTAQYNLPGAGTIADDITSTGFSSGADIVETGSATGNVVTVSAPTLSLLSSGTPVASTVVKNSANVTVYSLNLTAGVAEDVRVSSVRFAADDAAISVAGTASAASTNWNAFKLYDGAAQLGTTKDLTDDTTVDFVNFDGLNVTVLKGTTKTLDLKASALGSATGWFFGLTIAANQVIAQGASSATTITTTLGTAVTSTAQTLAASGTLTVVVDTSKPVAQNVAVGIVGKTGVSFSVVRATANNENVWLKTLTLTRTAGADADFASNGVQLYDGSTLLGSATLGATTATKATFNFTGSEVWQPLFAKDTAKILTVKGNLNGIGAGALSADAPKLEIAATTDLVATGSASGATINADAATTANNAMTLYKTVITVAPNSTITGGGTLSPSGLQTAGALKEVLRFNITADAAGPAYVETISITPNTNASVTADVNNDVQLFWDLDNYAAALQAGDFRATTGDICGAGSDETTTGVALTTAIKTTVLSVGVGADLDGANEDDFCNVANLEIAAGATRIFVVKMDTTGAVNPKTLSNDFAAIADVAWHDTNITISDIITLTKGLPLTGNTLSY